MPHDPIGILPERRGGPWPLAIRERWACDRRCPRRGQAMTFLEAIRNGFRKYAEFTGRAGRSEFWWWVLFVFLVNAALAAAWPLRSPGGSAILGSTLSALWSVVILLPTLAVL